MANGFFFTSCGFAKITVKQKSAYFLLYNLHVHSTCSVFLYPERLTINSVHDILHQWDYSRL